jgi:hypothetical protein
MATDVCEPQIIRALENDGWHLVRKPLPIRTGERLLFADFTAQRVIGDDAEIEEIVIVEVKCFTNPEYDLQELYTTVGQYHVYRAALAFNGLKLPLYLAVPLSAYERLIEDEVVSFLFESTAINLLIVDIEKEEIVRWLS